MKKYNKNSEDSLRNKIREILSEDFYSTPTVGDQTVSYYSPDTEKNNSYDYQPEETTSDIAKKLNIPYSPILNTLEDEDLKLVSKLIERFKKTGNLEIKYSLGWQGPLLSYIIEFLGIEVRKGNDKARLKLMEIFNPNNDGVKEMLRNYYNSTSVTNKNNTNIENISSKEVTAAVENMERLQTVNKLVEKYIKKGGNDYLLKYLIQHLRLRFYNEYNMQLDRSKRALTPKEYSQSWKDATTYYVSDIQNYLYQGNDEKGSNDNFIKFNQANKEIIDALKSKEHNPKVIAIIDGMINSKLDTEEMIDVYPKLFSDRKAVARAFSQTLKGDVAEYMDTVYRNYGLELPPVDEWKSKDITSSQDTTTKLKNDDNAIFEVRKIVRGILREYISPRELNKIEDYADDLFSNVNVDVEFTNHFMDRLNDPRNIKDIESGELKDLFNKLYVKYGQKIPTLRKGTEAVINDINSNINIPFKLVWNAGKKEFEMINKTVMRTKNFYTGQGQMKLKV